MRSDGLASDFNWMAGVMNAQMEQLKAEVSRQEAFTSAFAHELKTPLTFHHRICGYHPLYGAFQGRE